MDDNKQLLVRFAPYVPLLWFVSAVGFFGLNGVFIYYAVWQPEMMTVAMANPIALVFMVEAFVMVGFAAWAFWLHDFRKPGWVIFIILSIVGSLAFSIPFFILLHIRKAKAAGDVVSG